MIAEPAAGDRVRTTLDPRSPTRRRPITRTVTRRTGEVPVVAHHNPRKSGAHPAREGRLTTTTKTRGGLEVSTAIDTIRNGVDTVKMFATLDLIKAQPELAKFQFRASNRWIDGSHNRSTIKGFYAAGGEDATRSEAFVLDAGEPAILLGTDTGANPAEYLLHALAACLTTSIVYVAAARKVELTSVESTLTGDMDVRGALGVDDEPRNGFERIGVTFRVTGNAPEDKLRKVVERAAKRSAVYDMVSNGVPVTLEVATD
jgi:uncharacterized OsmC-like protein